MQKIKRGKFAQIFAVFGLMLPAVFGIAPLRNLLTYSETGKEKFTNVVELEKTEKKKQIVIYGKTGHAEVLGLVGQTNGEAIVIEKIDEINKIDLNKDIRLYSQTTKSLDEFRRIVSYIEENISPSATFQYFDTICRQVANRMPNIRKFAAAHDVILFVCGQKSSNGKILFHECKEINPRTYQVDKPEDIDIQWFQNARSIGICGATSTPKWLMDKCKNVILNKD